MQNVANSVPETNNSPCPESTPRTPTPTELLRDVLSAELTPGHFVQGAIDRAAFDLEAIIAGLGSDIAPSTYNLTGALNGLLARLQAIEPAAELVRQASQVSTPAPSDKAPSTSPSLEAPSKCQDPRAELAWLSTDLSKLSSVLEDLGPDGDELGRTEAHAEASNLLASMTQTVGGMMRDELKGGAR